jgi:hypothetical protein
MDLHERYESNQARRAFDAAMADAKAEIPVVKTNREGHNKAKYADLAAYAEVIPPIIGKHGLHHRYRAKQANGLTTVICIISHRDGYFEETELSATNDKSGNKTDIHALGSTLTYLQRYSLCLALGLVAGKDDDGQAAGRNAPENISGAQLQELIELADETQANKIKLCKMFNIECLADLPASKFDEAKRGLEGRRARMAANA